MKPATWGWRLLVGAAFVGYARSSGLYSVTYTCYRGSTENCTASLYQYTDNYCLLHNCDINSSDGGGWDHLFDFANGIAASVQTGMLAADQAGAKWWLVAGSAAAAAAAGEEGSTLYYYNGSGVEATSLTNVVSTLQYVQQADEFLATWQVELSAPSHRSATGSSSDSSGLEFGAMDPYLGKQSTMVNVTRTNAIPYASFGVSALDPATTAMIFVVAVPTSASALLSAAVNNENEEFNPQRAAAAAGGARSGSGGGGDDSDNAFVYSMVRIAPTGSGISVEYGKPAAATTAVQSVVVVPGLFNPTPLALTMSPATRQSVPGFRYTYSLVPWNVTAGMAANGAKVCGTWTSATYNSFHATAAGGGAVFAAAAPASEGRGGAGAGAVKSAAPSVVVRVDLMTGQVTQLSMAGSVGSVRDLVYIQ
eukprot:gene4978-2437_t